MLLKLTKIQLIATSKDTIAKATKKKINTLLFGVVSITDWNLGHDAVNAIKKKFLELPKTSSITSTTSGRKKEVVDTSNKYIKTTVIISSKIESGRRTVQHKLISCANVYLGRIDLIKIIIKQKIITPKKKRDSPKNSIDKILAEIIMLLYSAKKNNENKIEEYSRLYPATNSASASGKSKGVRFVSASILIKKIIIAGKAIALITIFVAIKWCKSKLPWIIKSISIVIDKGISYEISWAIARIPPIKEYLELLEMPASIIAKEFNPVIKKTNKKVYDELTLNS